MLCTLDATSQKNSEVWRIWPHWTMFSMIIMKSIVCYRHQCNLFFVDLKEGKSARMSILSMNFCYFKIHCYKKESPIRISNLHFHIVNFFSEIQLLNDGNRKDFTFYASFLKERPNSLNYEFRTKSISRKIKALKNNPTFISQNLFFTIKAENSISLTLTAKFGQKIFDKYVDK